MILNEEKKLTSMSRLGWLLRTDSRFSVFEPVLVDLNSIDVNLEFTFGSLGQIVHRRPFSRVDVVAAVGAYPRIGIYSRR